MVVIKDVPVPEKRLVRHEVFHEEIGSELVLYSQPPRWVKVERIPISTSQLHREKEVA